MTSVARIAPSIAVSSPEVELKVLLEALPLAEFLQSLEERTTPEIYDPDRPVQYTRTTYLDTEDLAYSRSGHPDPRVRLRIREYASARSLAEAPALTGLCFLELKESDETWRRKVRWRAPAALVRALVASGGREPSDCDAPPEIVERLRRDRPKPMVSTWYRRRSFASTDGVRITVDDEVWFCRPDETVPFAVLPPHVLEVKLSGETPAWLRDAMASLPPPTCVSKFRLAMSDPGRSAPSSRPPAGPGPG